VSWAIGTQPSLEKAPDPDDEHPGAPDDLGSGWIVALAAAFFVYNVLLCLDYPVSPDQWDRLVMRRYFFSSWDRVFPPDLALYSWPVPEMPVRHGGPVRVESGFRRPPHSTPELVLVGGGAVKEVSATERAAMERRDPEYNPADAAMEGGVPVVTRGLIGAASWPAVERWTPEYVAEAMPTVKPHISEWVALASLCPASLLAHDEVSGSLRPRSQA
jgi:hypothetical protein